MERNDIGGWNFGFTKVIGVCNVLEAESWGVYEGFATAWSLRLPRVIMETNCEDAVELLNRNREGIATSSLLPHIFELIDRYWSIRVYWVSRTGQCWGGAMTKLA
ncbi:hypothetical protein V6N11_042807 [Hibiscus sabdariffa]|uniref:RNase H type-1 domain-containing protein n=1 Tax=Hibiscus sabdariffa TaxID=183260 RepID=A0ABR2QXF2_9ROSI